MYQMRKITIASYEQKKFLLKKKIFGPLEFKCLISINTTMVNMIIQIMGTGYKTHFGSEVGPSPTILAVCNLILEKKFSYNFLDIIT